MKKRKSSRCSCVFNIILCLGTGFWLPKYDPVVLESVFVYDATIICLRINLAHSAGLYVQTEERTLIVVSATCRSLVEGRTACVFVTKCDKGQQSPSSTTMSGYKKPD
jgi:hypothetical protein